MVTIDKRVRRLRVVMSLFKAAVQDSIMKDRLYGLNGYIKHKLPELYNRIYGLDK